MMKPSARQILFLYIMAALALLDIAPTFAQLGTKLLSADIRTALAQNTLNYVTISGRSVKAYLALHGILRGKYEDKQFSGSWKIHDNMICLNFPEQEDNGCWTMFRLPDGQLQIFTSKGKPAGYIKVAEGNPNNF